MANQQQQPGTSTLRVEPERIKSLTLRIPRGLDLRIEFFEDGNPKLVETPLAFRRTTDGQLLLDCNERGDASGCRPVKWPPPGRGDQSGCKGPHPPYPWPPPPPPPPGE